MKSNEPVTRPVKNIVVICEVVHCGDMDLAELMMNVQSLVTLFPPYLNSRGSRSDWPFLHSLSSSGL